MGGAPRMPKPAPAPTLPSVSDPNVIQAQKDAATAAANAKGRMSTILTGENGFVDTNVKKTLLGS